MNYQKLLKELGISYLGSSNQSAKMSLSYKNGENTYGIYLAPYNMSGYQVCPNGQHCHEFCLNGSGRNKVESFVNGGVGLTRTDISRIKRTKLFYENRDLFMDLLIHEIKRELNYAKRNDMGFSVRLNCTSDLSPLIFKYKGSNENILDMFPNISFYDYSKCVSRYKLADSYDNYDLTFSYDGYNSNECEWIINQKKGRVAIVFHGNKLPKRFCGYDVIDGNKTDIRFRDAYNVIVGLHYHPTSNDYHIVSGKRVYIKPNTPFVIMENDERCEW